ncbi:MAG: DNA primase DnaG [Candidatus Marsarchaeota archaeon]|jgi:DNA primase|nr:DNA primase DnaG [Candidatus Marsarchaeota archaeon]
MGKKYIDIVKYIVEADFEINGNVEKPDIIGAIFGQTEGLLGTDLDLRELQRNGKIGRIEIEFSIQTNKTAGKLFLPSSLGRVETCILGAAIESVDRVGPFETSFKILRVEDTRNEKRKYIIERAKNLIKVLLSTEIPDSKEISEMVESDVKKSTITTYGADNLPAGPDVGKSEEVVLVEGRADVINLIKNDITNCIAVGGASNKISDTITKLAAEKDTVLFVDGDRGGEMIMKILITGGVDIDFVARAPDGKEVEELARKEIIKAMHLKVPIDQIMNRLNRESNSKKNNSTNYGHAFSQGQKTRSERLQQQNQGLQQRQSEDEGLKSATEIVNSLRETSSANAQQPTESTRQPLKISVVRIDDEDDSDLDDEIKDAFPKPENSDQDKETSSNLHESENVVNSNFIAELAELKNSLRGRLYDKNNNLISEVPVRQMLQEIQNTKGINAIVFDGIVTQRLMDLATRYNIRQVYGIRAQISKKYGNLLLYTSEAGLI